MLQHVLDFSNFSNMRCMQRWHDAKGHKRNVHDSPETATGTLLSMILRERQYSFTMCTKHTGTAYLFPESQQLHLLAFTIGCSH